MQRPSGTIFLLLFICFLAGDDSAGRTGSAPNLCTIPLTRVVKIPVIKLERESGKESANSAPSALTITQGAADELPEGPSGFDVLEDGGLLIADPLRSRLMAFDSRGNFQKVWNIGFASDSVTVTSDGLVLVREASTAQLHVFDLQGRPQLGTRASVHERSQAQILPGKNRGTVIRHSTNGANPGPLTIEFDKPGLTLLSIETLTSDGKGDTYVALESTAGGEVSEAISVNKYVRRYSLDGKVLCEIADIPLDYYIPPVDELRVHRGLVFQLQTTASEVRVNVWDTNPLCGNSH